MKESLLNARLSSVFEQFGKSKQTNDDLLTAITKVKEIYSENTSEMPDV